jgi:hypothetical protein
MAMTSQLRKLMVYICGDSGPFDELNPSFVTRRKWASELLYILNKRPGNVKQICSRLKISQKEALTLLEELAKIKAIREESGVYHVNFAIFTKDDLMTLAQATEPIANELVDRICSDVDRITFLARKLSAIQQVKIKKLLFAVIGCFVLDWLGLKILEEEELLVKSKPQPGNRNYLLFAREEIEQETAVKLYDKMYWGSHSDVSGKYTFTSFGDYGVRYALPDILWTFQASPKMVQTLFKSPSWITEKLSINAQLFAKKLLQDAAFLLFKLNTHVSISAKELIENNDEWLLGLVCLLEDMGYIVSKKERLSLNYPVFVAEDKKIIEQIGDIIIPSVTQTIRRNYLSLKKALKNTVPMKNKIALNEVLTEVWHWIFAQTNKTLADKGFFYNPPKRRAKEAQYIAWVAEFNFP